MTTSKLDIYGYLKKDHKKVAALFKKVVNAKDMEERFEIFKEINKELTLHADPEKNTFYAAINKTKKSEEEVEHANEEHSEIKALLKKLLKPNEDDVWLIHFGELKAIVEHHVKEEEEDIFPLAKKILSETRSRSLAEEMETEKQKIKAW